MNHSKGLCWNRGRRLCYDIYTSDVVRMSSSHDCPGYAPQPRQWSIGHRIRILEWRSCCRNQYGTHTWYRSSLEDSWTRQIITWSPASTTRLVRVAPGSSYWDRFHIGFLPSLCLQQSGPQDYYGCICWRHHYCRIMIWYQLTRWASSFSVQDYGTS